MKVYLIPGLGYNHRIFEKLDFQGFDITFLDWIEPKKNESIQKYAQRLFEPVPDNEDEIILIGHSFGGIVSQEIARVKKIAKIILISSIKSRAEMPLSFKLVHWLHLHVFFSKELSIKTIKYWGKNHGFPQTEDHELFKDMVRSVSSVYLKWALKTLSAWEESQLPANTKLFQIHGTNDKTFPYPLIQEPDISIEKGSHVILHNQPDQISMVLREEITNKDL